MYLQQTQVVPEVQPSSPPSLGLCSCLQYKHTACLAAGLENNSLLSWPRLFGQGVAAFVISSFAFPCTQDQPVPSGLNHNLVVNTHAKIHSPLKLVG